MMDDIFVDLAEAIEIDGYDYALMDYADWSDIPDPEFQHLYAAYKKAYEELRLFLINKGIDI